MTKVVNLRELGGACIPPESYDVLIATRSSRTPNFWRSPFTTQAEYSNKEAHTKYEKWFTEWMHMDPYLIRRLQSLHGKTLACTCGAGSIVPETCHGHVLVRAVEWSVSMEAILLIEYLEEKEIHEAKQGSEG